MVKPIPCSSCNGLGCKRCNYIGFFGIDERGQEFYLSKDASGNVMVSGMKSSGSGGSPLLNKLFSFIFGQIGKSLEEPRDFIWESRQKR
jgi:hypothetical protein